MKTEYKKLFNYRTWTVGLFLEIIISFLWKSIWRK